MKKALKKILRISGWTALVIISISTVALLLFFFDKPLVKNIAQKYLSRKTGFTVQIGKLDYMLSPLTIEVLGLRFYQNTPIQRLDFRVQKLEAKGKFRRLLRQEKPVFDTLDLNGGEVRYQLKRIPQEKVDYQMVIRQAAGALGYAKKITIKECDIMVALPGQTVSLARANLDLAQAGQDNTYAFAVSSEKAGLKLNRGGISYESRLNSAGSITLSTDTSVTGRFTLGSLCFTAGCETQSFKTVTVETDAEWRPGENKIAFSRLGCDIPDLAKASGSMVLDYNEGFSLAASAEAQVEDTDAVLARLEPYLPQELKNLQLLGKVKLAGTYHLARNPQGAQENLEAYLGTEQIKLIYGKAAFPIQADVSGRLAIRGPLSDIRVTGALRSSVGPLSGKYFKLRNSQFNLQIKADRNYLTVPYFEATLRGLSLALQEKALSFEEVKAKGNGSLDFPRRNIALDIIEARIPSLPPLRASAKLDLAPRGEKYVSLKSEGLKIPALRSLFSSFFPSILAGWELDAICDIAIEARTSRSKPDESGFSTFFKIKEGKFNDPTFAIAGDGLLPELRIEGKYSFSRDDLNFSGTLKLGQGESLWKDYYISWKKFPLTANFSGVFNIPVKKLDRLAGHFSSPSLGEIRGEGTACLGRAFCLDLKAHAQLSLDSLQSLYSQASMNKDSRVALKGMMESEAQILKGPEGLSIKGNLTLSEAAIENQSRGFSMQGITAEIPIFYEAAGEESAKEESFSHQGFLRAEIFQAGPFITPQPLDLVLRGGRNAFQIEPFSIDLFGGQLKFGKTSLFISPQARSFDGFSSLRLESMDISRIPINSAQFQLSGKVRADFLRVEISPKKITARGEGEIEVFGGKVIVKDISIINPLSKGRAVVLNVDLIDLDLKKLTDSVPFGEVTGIIRGEIRDLSFSYGQPERFNLNLESVKKKGVPQTFSLKAVDNITVISSGQNASLGSGKLWMQFIKGFRYDKIGIVSTLKNDTFTLNGTIKEKGVEYLVKKPWPFGINVINRMPEKKISFKEMTQRLKRIGQSEKNEDGRRKIE